MGTRSVRGTISDGEKACKVCPKRRGTISNGDKVRKAYPKQWGQGAQGVP